MFKSKNPVGIFSLFLYMKLSKIMNVEEYLFGGTREMINVAVIDDNVQLTELIKEHLSTLDDMEIVGTAHNGFEGIKLVKNEHPDVVILDLIMPHSDGLSLMEQINLDKIDTKVLMLTAMGREDIIQKANSLGASYFLLKPFELDQLSDAIRTIYPQHGYFKKDQSMEQKQSKLDNNLEIKISNILRSMGIPANLKGYLFLREAIQIVFQNLELINGVTKVIYPSIASKFHTTPSRVERAIRHSIEVGWNRGNLEQLNFVFGNTVSPLKGRPTNAEFIALIADHLRLQKVC